MANHASAKKRIRRNLKRNIFMSTRRSKVRSFVKSVELAIAAGEKEKAAELFRTTESELMRGVKVGAVKVKNASRKISRLAAHIKAM
ncbi:MAG: 30S ribosomal protein S20 [Alphaproteobacteria bacterium]